MERKQLNTLIVNDNDMDCQKDRTEVTLNDITLAKVGFVSGDLEKFDLIVYKGRLGTKVLRVRV